MISINDISETEALRAELQILNSILGKFDSGFLEDPHQSMGASRTPRNIARGPSLPLGELSKMATEWLQTRNTLHCPALDRARLAHPCVEAVT
jgi:hypothetical protein